MIEISVDDLSDGKVIRLLQEHRLEMLKHSPPESVHALDLKAMQNPEVRFFSAKFNGEFAACAALKHHQASFGELKSMKTDDKYLRRGMAAHLLDYLITEAKRCGYQKLYLETGTLQVFSPAKALYAKKGFLPCEPFADYEVDPHSICMCLDLM